MGENGKRSNYGSTTQQKTCPPPPPAAISSGLSTSSSSSTSLSTHKECGGGEGTGDDNTADIFTFNDIKLPFPNDCYMQQIREQAGNPNGPVMVNYQYARSRRRPLLRTKSESDFQAMLEDEDVDVEKMRERLVKRYGQPKGSFHLKALPKLSKQQWMVLATLALVEFSCFCTMSILAPFFPSEAHAKGLASSISGMVFSIYALVIFLTSPIMGIIVGQVGAKFLLILGVFLGGTCNILFGVLGYVEDTQVFTVYCFLVRICEACGSAAFSTASYTIVAEIFPDNVGVVLGLLETFVGLGLTCGPAAGGFLYDYGGYGLPFYTLGGLMLCTIPLAVVAFPSTRWDPNQSHTPGGMVKLLKIPSIAVICLVIVIVSNAWGFMDPTLEPHLREFNLSAKQLGLIFLLLSAVYAVSSPVWGFLADKIDRTWIMMVAGLLISGFGLFLLGPAPFLPFTNTIPLNLVSLFILGASIGLALLPTFEALLDTALEAGYPDDASTYGLIAGLWSGSYSLGEVMGPSLGGFLLDHFGFPICATVMAALCIFLGIFVLIYYLSINSDDSSPSTSSECSSGDERTSRTKLTTEVSDSGISENAGLSSSSASSSSSVEDIHRQLTNSSTLAKLVDETTPLLLSSERGSGGGGDVLRKSKSGNLLISLQKNMIESSPIDILSDDDSFIHESCVQARGSFPEVLKTVCFTGSGAVEV